MKTKTKVVVKRNFSEVLKVDRQDEMFLTTLMFHLLDNLEDSEDVRLSIEQEYVEEEAEDAKLLAKGWTMESARMVEND